MNIAILSPKSCFPVEPIQDFTTLRQRASDTRPEIQHIQPHADQKISAWKPPSGRAAQRRLLSASEKEAVFDRIVLPQALRVHSVGGMSTREALSLLTQIHQCFLTSLPFENLSLHYSKARFVDLDIDAILEKVTEPGNLRGGYCLENNSLLVTLLRSLGFNAYTAAARVHEGEGVWTGWRHCVTLVTIADTKYVLDVGYGTRAHTSPLPLIHDATIPQIGSACNRARYTRLSDHTDPFQRAWRLDYRRSDREPWQICYAFTTTEIFPPDLEATSLVVSKDPKAWFNQKVVIAKFIADVASGGVCGTQSLVGATVKVEENGDVKMVKTLNSEEERVDCIKDIFGICMSQTQKKSIKGLCSEIVGPSWSRYTG